MPARLILYKDNQKLGMDLADGVYRVGRDKPADIAIPDGTISGNHAEIQINGSTCLVRDLGSTNGTFVNGSRISAVTPIKESDELRFGGVPVRINFPAMVKPVAAPAGPSAASVKMGEAKRAAGRLGWTTRYFLAGMWAILFLLVLLFFILLYAESVSTESRILSRYQALAGQYIHVLGRDPIPDPVPAPAVDATFAEPIMVADPAGRILYPKVPEGVTAPESPLIRREQKTIYPEAKFGMLALPGTGTEGRPEIRSYPVRQGGEILGYVIARPGADPAGGVGTSGLMAIVSAIVALLLLSFTLRPVNRMVRSHMADLQSKLGPLANGFVDSLPRSRTVPELNGLAEEMEKALVQVRSASSAGARAAGEQRVEFAELLPALVDSVQVAYCFVNSEFKVLSANRSMSGISELMRVSTGDSIFEGGMSSIQAKQLVQAISEARSSGQADTRMEMTRGGKPATFDVSIRSFQDPATRAPIYGVIFNQAAA
jgi:pSer/pThr/pTyr-binding forkhead associated (FHA) protein